MEVFEAAFSWRWGLAISTGVACIPAAKTSDVHAAQARLSGWMRVSEPLALSFEISVEGGERCDPVGIEGKLNRLMGAAISRLQQLDECSSRGLGGDRYQLEKPVGGGDLAVFKPEALGLEDLGRTARSASGACTIRRRAKPVLHSLPGRGEKPPVQRLGAGGRIGLICPSTKVSSSS